MTDPALAKETKNGRYYTHPSRMSEAPSITNIKNVKSIDALKYWAAGECARYAADNLARLATLKSDEIYQLVRGAPWGASSKRGQSSNVGDVVHAWLDAIAKGETVDPATYTAKDGQTYEAPVQAKQMWRQIVGPKGFIDTYKPQWHLSEFTVWSDQYNYAGTADLAAYIGNALVLIDHKTGKNAYPDTALQLAALANADYILSPDGTETPLPKFDRFGILHIRPRGCRLIPVDHIDEAFKAFLGLKACFDWQVAYQDETLKFAPKLEVTLAA